MLNALQIGSHFIVTAIDYGNTLIVTPAFLERKMGSERLGDLAKVKVTQLRVVEPRLKLRPSDSRT